MISERITQCKRQIDGQTFESNSFEQQTNRNQIKRKPSDQQAKMQELLSSLAKTQENSSSKDKQLPPVQQQLFSLYETRLKSLMETLKVYQETLAKDKESGALAFMNTPELATYRVDREQELLKDVMLSQKQRLVIKALTSYHEVKKQNDQLKSQFNKEMPKNPFPSKSQQQMAAQKDIMFNNNRTSIDKQSRISSKIGQGYCHTTAGNIMTQNNNRNSSSRLTIVSHQQEGNTSTASISVYERLLQEKLAMIKELEKKNKHLTLENEQQLHKIAQLQANLEKALKQQMGKKQCQQCMTLKQLNEHMTKKFELVNKQLQSSKLKLKDQQSIKRAIQGDLQIKQLKLQQLSMRLQSTQRQLQQVKNQKQQQQKQQKTSKPQTQNNTHTINELKQKLLLHEQQLMSMTNSFSFLREDISDSVYSEILRLKNSHMLLKEQIKSQITTMKKQVFSSVNEIIAAVRLKSEGIKTNEEIAKKLRQIDNQLDYFIQQKHIKI